MKPTGEPALTEALKARLVELRGAGFNRLYQRGNIFEFSTPESLLDLDFTLPVFILLDRIVVSADNRARIVDAAEIAYREGGEILFEALAARADAASVLAARAGAGLRRKNPSEPAAVFGGV